MIRKNLKLLVATAAVGAVALTGTATAAVTFDPASGTGFVGKGDVQVPFGWNDAKLQQFATGVSFVYESESDDEYAVTCEWDTGSKKIVRHIQTKRANVGSMVTYDVKSATRNNPNGKVTGFKLTGLQNVVQSSDGSVPVVGASCPETGNDAGTDNAVDKKITGVELLSSSATQSLTALHAGENKSAVIWPPPPAPAI